MSARVTTITRLVFPDQANHHGTLFGGEALGLLASCGSIAAQRRARMEVVLASSGSVDFVAPIPLGLIVESRAEVTRVGRTSIDVGVTLEAEELLSGKRSRACAATFVFVAVDATGRPSVVSSVDQHGRDGRRQYPRRPRALSPGRDRTCDRWNSVGEPTRFPHELPPP